jgi:hypothetical protein
MTWLSSFFVAVLTAVVAAVAAGVVAGQCVSWYQVPSREGESAYYVAGIVLLGGFIGFLEGLILSRFLGGPGTAGFFQGFGICSGAMVALAAIAAAVAWSLADIPPTIDGRQLDLIVEFRLPKGAPQPVVSSEGNQHVFFGSMGSPGRPDRASKAGVLDVANARQENGRWIVPGSVFIFTSRGKRDVTIQLGDGHAMGFQVPFPGRPGRQYEEWSDWQPPLAGPGKPWPDTEMSYRFRVQRIKPPEAVDDDSGRRFAALSSDAPLEQWLGFFTDQKNPDRDRAIARAAAGRQAELARFLRSPDYNLYRPALYCVQFLPAMDPEVHQALRDMAADIEAQIRKYNAMSPQQEGYAELGKEICWKRFVPWANAWPMVRILGIEDGRPTMEAIIQLAAVRKESSEMQSIVSDAENTLVNFFPPLQNQ